MNVPVHGKFAAFDAEIVFDPATPEAGRIKLVIETSGITTGNPEADQALPSADWFNVAEHPSATFEGQGFKPVGDNAFEIEGTLSLKGHSETVTLKAQINTGDAPDNAGLLNADASGEAHLSRTAFKIGEGQWASTATIADEVIVGFKLKAQRPQ